MQQQNCVKWKIILQEFYQLKLNINFAEEN